MVDEALSRRRCAAFFLFFAKRLLDCRGSDARECCGAACCPEFASAVVASRTVDFRPATIFAPDAWLTSLACLASGGCSLACCCSWFSSIPLLIPTNLLIDFDRHQCESASNVWRKLKAAGQYMHQSALQNGEPCSSSNQFRPGLF